MRTFILSALLVTSVTFNILVLSVSWVATAASTVFDRVTGLASVVTELRGSYVNVSQELVDVSEELGSARKGLQVRDTRIAKLETDVRTKAKHIQTLEGDVARLKPKAVTYRGKKKLLGEAVSDTTHRISRRTAAGASRNIASTFGEAVPMIGIAVVVGATVWEVKDACDTMKDLHELEVSLDPSKANDASVKEVCGMAVPSKQELIAMVKASPGKAWQKTKDVMPDLPEMPEFHMPDFPDLSWPDLPDVKMPDMPKVDWSFWN